MEQLGLESTKTNVNGGAVALGHPNGASGARVLVTPLYEMARRDAKRGVAARAVSRWRVGVGNPGLARASLLLAENQKGASERWRLKITRVTHASAL
jgi:hypothetical protein